MTDRPEKRAFARVSLEEKWALVEGLLERVSRLETRMYDLERRSASLIPVITFPPQYIPEPTSVPEIRPSRTDDPWGPWKLPIYIGDPVPPWPEITCQDRT